MRFEGYVEDSRLPFKKGDRITIPAGVSVRSTNSSKHTYVQTTSRTVKLHSIMPGRSERISAAFSDKYLMRELAARGFNYEPIIALKDANDPEYYRGYIHLSNPAVCWVGEGYYFCEVDINDVLEANNVDIS
jgi:hypothetical protein